MEMFEMRILCYTSLATPSNALQSRKCQLI